MSLQTQIVLEWANGEYLFALRVREVEALEMECWNPETRQNGIGLGAIYMRVMGGGWYLSDLRNVIRLGLVGGGMGAVEARRMVQTYVDGAPVSSIEDGALSANCPLNIARVVLSAAITGVVSDEGKTTTPQE